MKHDDAIVSVSKEDSPARPTGAPLIEPAPPEDNDTLRLSMELLRLWLEEPEFETVNVKP